MNCATNSKRTEHTIGEIFRRWGRDYSRDHAMTEEQRRTLQRLSMCRTAALGGHLESCDHCEFERPVYNSCRDRNCPTCQGISARKWLEKRETELLHTHYFRCVFTVPDTLNALVFAAPTQFYSILFQAMWGTLRRLFTEAAYGLPAVLAALHTWGSGLWLHPHIHCIVSGGGLSEDGTDWHSSPDRWLFDVHEASHEFRTRVLRLIKRRAKHFVTAPVDINALLTAEAQRDWVVHCKPPESGPEQLVRYLARYAYRTAISNSRILDVSDDGVLLDCKSYRAVVGDGPAPHRPLQLDGVEFIRRFMLHILPDSFKRIRFYGVWAGGSHNAKLEAARKLLPEPLVLESPAAPEEETPAEDFNRCICPQCGGNMITDSFLEPKRAPPVVMRFEGRNGHNHAA